MRPISYSIRSERVKGTSPKKSGKTFLFQVRIFIKTYDRLDLEDIRYVIYELHPTFPNPKQISKSIHNNFEIRIWTWGFFDVKAKLVMKGGRIEEIDGYVDYDVSDAKK